jgi:hypothetical protein
VCDSPGNHPNRFARLWQGEWTSDTATAINRDDIAAATTLPGPLDGPERGYIFTGGLDLGLTRDASALVIVGQHVGYRDVLEHDLPPLDPVRAALVLKPAYPDW